MQSPDAQKTVEISNPQGLHARPAELMVRLAMQFESDVEVIRDGQTVDAKSILHVLTLGAGQGSKITLQARGADAQDAVEAIVQLVENEFASDETMSQESPS